MKAEETKPLSLEERRRVWAQKSWTVHTCRCGAQTTTYPGDRPRGKWVQGSDGWYCSKECRPAPRAAVARR